MNKQSLRLTLLETKNNQGKNETPNRKSTTEDSINRKHPNEANSGEKNGLTKHQWLLKRESFWNNYRRNSCRRR